MIFYDIITKIDRGKIMLDHRVFTFMKVCETLNYTKASKALHITQPAVSSHIKYLEELLQTKLFQFRGKQCFLTKDGKAFLDFSHTVNNDFQHFQLSLKQEMSPYHFGTTLTIGEYFMPDILSKLLLRMPQLELKMLIDNTTNILNAIDQGKIDFGIIEGAFSRERYDFKIYHTEPFVAVSSPKLQLNKGTISYEDLLALPLIIRERGSGTRDVLEIALKQHHITLNDFNHIIEIGNLNTIKSLVKNNIGISFFYNSVVQEEIASKTLTLLPLSEKPIFHDFSFVWRKNSYFKQEYQEIFNNLKIL